MHTHTYKISRLRLYRELVEISLSWASLPLYAMANKRTRDPDSSKVEGPGQHLRLSYRTHIYTHTHVRWWYANLFDCWNPIKKHHRICFKDVQFLNGSRSVCNRWCCLGGGGVRWGSLAGWSILLLAVGFEIKTKSSPCFQFVLSTSCLWLKVWVPDSWSNHNAFALPSWILVL